VLLSQFQEKGTKTWYFKCTVHKIMPEKKKVRYVGQRSP